MVWLLLAVVASLNGLLRNTLITPRIGESGGHVVSTVLLCVLFIAVTSLVIRWIGPRSGRDVKSIGMMWLVMTIVFEFVAGHYAFGHSWDRLFADYNIASGRVWILVLITTYLAPMIAAWIRKIDLT
jgi:hypothetical protein